METGDTYDRVLGQLEMLNKQVARQNSLGRMFWAGIIYGIGFFVGSAVIATILFGILGPWVGEVPWIRNAFETGASMLRR